jgi:hypothetical protein
MSEGRTRRMSEDDIRCEVLPAGVSARDFTLRADSVRARAKSTGA